MPAACPVTALPKSIYALLTELTRATAYTVEPKSSIAVTSVKNRSKAAHPAQLQLDGPPLIDSGATVRIAGSAIRVEVPDAANLF